VSSSRESTAWLHRRVGFGLEAGRLEELAAAGVDVAIDRLVDPDGHDIPPTADDLWAGMELAAADAQERRRLGAAAIDRWLSTFTTTERPLEEWMAWFWHGHFVSSAMDVQSPVRMVDQMNLFRRLGLGDFRTLLREVTVDPAMLIYLDGAQSTAAHPNENYGREMLELFALGIGQFDEPDVQAAAAALTGWRIRPGTGQAFFAPRQHDDTRRTLLGVGGVHDLETVVDAVVGHEACAPFVAGRLAEAILGPDVDDGLVESLGRDFAASGLEIRPLVRSILEAGAIDDAGGPLVDGPLPWLMGAQRATGARLPLEVRLRGLNDAGHLPWLPPNVGGWPGGSAWLGSSTTAARFNLAAAVAQAVPEDNPAHRAASSGDLDGLAVSLLRPEGFSAPTRDALAEAGGTGRGAAVAVLTTALASPDLVLA